MNENLKIISQAYREKYGFKKNDLDNLYLDYYNRNLKPISEAFISAAAVNALWVDGSFDSSNLTEQQAEAFSLAFPHLNIEDISNYSGESLDGLLNAWKGKLFEVQVRDDLNNGETVGNLHLLEDQTAVLADSPIQPGWDMAILDSDGNVLDEIQLKATDLISYVEASAERYPDISILATSEVAGATSASAEIITTDFSNKEIEDELGEAVVSSGIDSMWDVLLPSLPIIINLYGISKGSLTPDEGIKNVAASTAAISTGYVAHSLIEDFVTDTLIDTVLTGGISFFARLAFGWLFGSDQKKKEPEVFIDVEVIKNILVISSNNARLIGVNYKT